jgi:hypothetical protein
LIVSSVIAGVAAVIAALIGVRNHIKLTEIHVLVNSRLDSALTEIDDLKTQRDIKHDEESK